MGPFDRARGLPTGTEGPSLESEPMCMYQPDDLEGDS
jgi:hypothetical protein